MGLRIKKGLEGSTSSVVEDVARPTIVRYAPEYVDADKSAAQVVYDTIWPEVTMET